MSKPKTEMELYDLAKQDYKANKSDIILSITEFVENKSSTIVALLPQFVYYGMQADTAKKIITFALKKNIDTVHGAMNTLCGEQDEFTLSWREDMRIFSEQLMNLTSKLTDEVQNVPPDLDKIQDLIDQGANPDGHNFIGWKAIALAAASGNNDVISLLLENGVHVDSADRKNMTAIIAAIVNDKLKTVKFLIKNDADLTIKHEGMTPLGWAQAHNRTDIIDILYRAGAPE